MIYKFIMKEGENMKEQQDKQLITPTGEIPKADKTPAEKTETIRILSVEEQQE